MTGTAFSSFSTVMAPTGQASTQALQKLQLSSTTAIPSFMLNEPKGQAERQASHPVQASASMINLAISFASFSRKTPGLRPPFCAYRKGGFANYGPVKLNF